VATFRKRGSAWQTPISRRDYPSLYRTFDIIGICHRFSILAKHSMASILTVVDTEA
jgi:hypothetical protein